MNACFLAIRNEEKIPSTRAVEWDQMMFANYDNRHATTWYSGNDTVEGPDHQTDPGKFYGSIFEILKGQLQTRFRTL